MHALYCMLPHTAEVDGEYGGNDDAARLGDIITYNYTLRNLGTTTISSLVLEDSLVSWLILSRTSQSCEGSSSSLGVSRNREISTLTYPAGDNASTICAISRVFIDALGSHNRKTPTIDEY